MNSFILFFLFGDLSLQFFPQLPSLFITFNLLFLSILFSLLIRIKYLILLPAFLAGFAFTLWHAHSISSFTLNKDWEEKPLLVRGTITSLPAPGKFGTTFTFKLNTLSDKIHTEYPDATIRLNWPHKFTPKHLKAADTWQLSVKLKRIHGVQSPKAYDYEAWAFENGIRASGVVLDARDNQFLQSQFSPLLKLRQFLQEKIQASGHSPWLMALMLGERIGISQADWQVLRNTGTNHLMAIGGLHIGMAAGFAYFLMNFIWRRLPRLSLIMPAQQVSALAALFIGYSYAALSGFSLPAQRASVMLVVGMLAIFFKRNIHSWNIFSLAILCVLIINPLAVLSESFCLSFLTIALILYAMENRVSPSGFWWKHGRIQWVIGLGLIPCSFYFFQECSILSFIANSISIPWLAIGILPLCLLANIFFLISPSLASLLLWVADKSLAGLWMILSLLSQSHFSSWPLSIPNLLYFLLMMSGFLLLLMPAGLPLRWLGLIWILPAFLYQPSKPAQGEYWLNLLDVGQGLSVIIQTAKHTLVYDTGPNLGSSDMGASVVLPFLRNIKTTKIDLMVISHSDNDHIGGMKAILHAYPHTLIKTSVPSDIACSHAYFCNAGDSWVWDGVKFTFIYPFNHDTGDRNNSSCVLSIDNGSYKVLLPGDIEKKAELDLISETPQLLQANLIIAPHHGSQTSGLEAFIRWVNPEIVLYATGYRNRYHFPHESVLETYERLKVQAYDTVDSGSMRFKIGKNADPISERWRVSNKRYWHEA